MLELALPLSRQQQAGLSSLQLLLHTTYKAVQLGEHMAMIQSQHNQEARSD
jgi:hypothetical protein